MAMPAGIEYIDKGYDVPRLNEYLDFINLLSYDYHSSYEPAVNHHSPLYPLEEDNEYNYDSELTIVRRKRVVARDVPQLTLIADKETGVKYLFSFFFENRNPREPRENRRATVGECPVVGLGL